MGERKVLNKYYPPDFDATKLPRNRKPIDRQECVRTMLPMNIQCSSCGEFMYAGKKFNSKKELAIGEDYLTIKIWRFYIKCVMCSSEITFKTDPKNQNYVVERGAKRNFEPWTAALAADKEQEDFIKEQEEDAMAALENRQRESKNEMEQMDALERLQAMSHRHSQRTSAELLLLHQRKYQSSTLEKQEQADEQAVRRIYGDRDHPIVRRLDDDGDDNDDHVPQNYSNDIRSAVKIIEPDKPSSTAILEPVVVVKRKRNPPPPSSQQPQKKRPPPACPQPTGVALVSNYSSDSD